MFEPKYEIAEVDDARTLWLVTFDNGEEFVVFNEEEIVDQFGDGSDYIVVRGTWRPDE